MRIRVQHVTRYRFEGDVWLEPHTLRLRPRDDGAQTLLHFDLRIDPVPAGSTKYADQDGNVVTHVWFGDSVRHLEIQSRFEVETTRENPFDFLLPDPAIRGLPIAYPEPLRPLLLPSMDDAGVAAPVRALALRFAEEARWETVAFLLGLNQGIYKMFRHVRREHGPPLAPAQTLERGEGSCRDMAVLLCDACRSLGFAARFVSGYTGHSVEDESSDIHAWAEVYLPGAGWRGFDPTQGLAVATSHVAVAACAVPALAAPVTGSYRGAYASHMDSAIEIVSGAGSQV
jgi:transglutaminase-like putative cysteine protease